MVWRHHDNNHPFYGTYCQATSAWRKIGYNHYSDVITSTMASQITGVLIVYWMVCSGADQRKHQSSASLRGIHVWPVNSQQKGPVTRKMFPFDDVIMMISGRLLMFTLHWLTLLGWILEMYKEIERNTCILFLTKGGTHISVMDNILAELRSLFELHAALNQ